MSKRYTRREAIKTAVGLGVASIGAASMPNWLSQFARAAEGGAADSQPARRPNIIFILVDDLPAVGVGYAGKFPFFKTPNIDRLAAEGMVFNNAFVTTSLCSPSRASFLTGAYVHNHGVRDNYGLCDPQLTTFPQVLQKSGYETAFIGKWHMVDKDDPRPGFDYWLSFRGQGVYQDPKLNENGRKFQAQGYITDLLTDYADTWLRQKHDKPFAMMLWHKAVHGPFTSAERHKTAFADAEIPQPANFETPEATEGKPQWQKERPRPATSTGPTSRPVNDPNKWNGRIPQRLSMLRAALPVDDSVGKILETLEQTGQLDNTIIVFTSDNGYFLGEHGRTDKRLAYEESIRIPMVVWAPKLFKPGKIDEMVLNIDFAPTFLELAGAEIPPSVDGQSFLGLLKGQKSPWRDRFLYEYFRESNNMPPTLLGVRTDRWKYVTHPDRPDQIDELYDLKDDSIEMHNLAVDPKHADQLKTMKAMLEELKAQTRYRNLPEVLPATPRGAASANKD